MVERREFCMLAVAALAALQVRDGIADTTTVEDAIAQFTGSVTPGDGTVKLTAPEIAENGNTVPVSVSVDSPMTAENHVTEVLVLASGNPLPGVARFRFSPSSGQASASTRIRLAKTQDLIAIARMNDGSLYMDRTNVKVTIGGCGG